jgi:signal transduction histidine kinase
MADPPRRGRPPQSLLDVGVPVVLAVLTVVQLAGGDVPGDPTLVTVSALASIAPLAARRRAPLTVVAVVFGAVVVQYAVGNGQPATFASFLAAMVAVYSLARHASVRRLGIGVLLVAAAVGAAALLEAPDQPVDVFGLVYPLVYFGVAAAVGVLLAQRAARLAAVEDRATALEGQLAREAELAAAQERARIARELHDVVAHGLSLMVVQAEAAEEVLAASPQAAVAPLRRIQDTGRQSLGEMRRLLGVLRTTEGDGVRPQPSLAGLDELAADARSSGLDVDLEMAGNGAELPLGVQLAAFRIAQEALTNVRRHSGAQHVVVRLTVRADELFLEVRDDGRGPVGQRVGHGLVGMRERAALYGGTLELGPVAGGGFRVAAILPVGGEPR